MVIYKTTNLINGKFYIGKDKNNENWYYGSGKILIYAIKKYGKENFKKEIIEYCENIHHLKEREIYWIEFYNATDKSIGYNIQKGGDGGDNYQYLTEEELKEVKKKISIGVKASIASGKKKHTGFNSDTARAATNKGHSTRTPEDYKKISERGNKTKMEKGTHPSLPESKKLNSEKVKEFWKNNPDIKIKTSKKLSDKWKGRKKIDIFIEKYGLILGEEKYNSFIKKLSDSKKGKPAWNKGRKK